jgi:predicted nucleotide-binding protein
LSLIGITMWSLSYAPRLNSSDSDVSWSLARRGEHREAVARFLEQLGLEAVILHEQANKGRALITKFHEVASDIGFAVVLMTADDVGGLRESGQQQARARQNVIFELGFFIGALGPDRVAALTSN